MLENILFKNGDDCMATEIYIVSGFLGAGKTTLIQKLLKDMISAKVAIIENDFGEMSVDTALLKSGNVEVKELNSGCICCSLSGNFVSALIELITRLHPDKIIIEPSGVGKMSDILNSISDSRIHPFVSSHTSVTVVDVNKCRMYLNNFGEFFEDQIRYADTVLLSRTENHPEKIPDAIALIQGLNQKCPILSQPWNRLTTAEILRQGQGSAQAEPHCCGQHDHHEHCEGLQSHPAEDVFDTVTIQTSYVFTIDELKQLVMRMERISGGNVLRAKGILHGVNGNINLQYTPGEIQITKASAAGNLLCIIGKELKKQELINLFKGD